MTIDTSLAAGVARINGVALNALGETLSAEALRQRACTELLRQAAQRAGLLEAADTATADGVISATAAAAIESLLEQNIRVPEPSAEACRRHYAAHASRYCAGERVRARHILFAVTPGMDVAALRRQAEAVLLDVRCHAGDDPEAFARAAVSLSNCPSGARGGDLGWLSADECAPEFARELFGHVERGVLARLVHSRFGLHVVEVLERDPGTQRPFEAVRGSVANLMQQQTYVTALGQYLRVLAGAAEVEGVDLEGAGTPLVQ